MNPGNARLIKALAAVPAAAATSVVALAAGAAVDCVLRIEPWSGFKPRFLLVR
jgi:hypothetical protein